MIGGAASPRPEVVADCSCVIGENPLWHSRDSRLCWVDIPNGILYRFDPATGTHEASRHDGQIGGFTIQEDGSLLFFMAKGAVKLLRDGRFQTVVEGIPGEEGSRFNDVIADPEGRVFCGTLEAGDRKGSLYRLDTDRTITRVVSGIGCSNGMGFTPDGKGMYYVDSVAREVYLFDYDRSTGGLSHQRVFLKPPESLGTPDGMTVDAKGFAWVAFWGGSCLIRFSPEAREERRIYFTARLVTSVIFGGSDYKDIYVTTAGGDNKAENGPSAGSVFRLRTGIRGVAEYFSRIQEP
jgi:D-xylono/L-arabinono-1,4-lactonase